MTVVGDEKDASRCEFNGIASTTCKNAGFDVIGGILVAPLPTFEFRQYYRKAPIPRNPQGMGGLRQH